MGQEPEPVLPPRPPPPSPSTKPPRCYMFITSEQISQAQSRRRAEETDACARGHRGARKKEEKKDDKEATRKQKDNPVPDPNRFPTPLEKICRLRFSINHYPPPRSCGLCLFSLLDLHESRSYPMPLYSFPSRRTSWSLL